VAGWNEDPVRKHDRVVKACEEQMDAVDAKKKVYLIKDRTLQVGYHILHHQYLWIAGCQRNSPLGTDPCCLTARRQNHVVAWDALLGLHGKVYDEWNKLKREIGHLKSVKDIRRVSLPHSRGT
jgi:hypothetical protein